MKEGKFVRGIVESDVFGVAGGVRHDALLLGHPGNHARTQIETVSADGAAGYRAVSIVGV